MYWGGLALSGCEGLSDFLVEGGDGFVLYKLDLVVC